MMRTGSQRNPITIQRQVQVGKDKLNSPIFVWSNWRAEIFCEVETRRGKEQFDPIANIRYSEEVWRFRTRYDEVVGADTSMRIIHEGSTFNIKAILPDGQRHDDCVIEATVQDAVLGSRPLAIAITDSINTGTVGVAYSLQLRVTGGTAPYVFTLLSGTLPTGLSIGSGTGLINGTPSATASNSCVFKVADAAGDIAQLPAVQIVIEAA